jgi:hypothetical protein
MVMDIMKGMSIMKNTMSMMRTLGIKVKIAILPIICFSADMHWYVNLKHGAWFSL